MVLLNMYCCFTHPIVMYACHRASYLSAVDICVHGSGGVCVYIDRDKYTELTIFAVNLISFMSI